MSEQHEPRELVIYFSNGRMVRAREDRVRFAHLGQNTDEENTPDTGGRTAIVNWDNVCFVREWIEPEEEEE